MNITSQQWQLVRLKEVCDLQNGYAFKSSDYVEHSNTLNCRMSNIRPNGVFDLDHNPTYLPDSYVDQHKNYILNDGDVIIAMTDMATKAKILGVPTVVYTKGKNLLLNQRVGKLVIKNPNSLYFPYLQYALNRDRVKKYYLKFAGGGLQINLGKDDLLSVKIPLPPLEEQKRIAAILDKADAIRRKRKEAIALTEELLRSTFLDMFGDPVTNPKEWEKVKLNAIVKKIDSGWSPKCDSREANSSEWGMLKLGAVTWGHFNSSENKALLSGTEPRPELEVKKGDLLFSRKNTYELVGATAYVHSTRAKLLIPDLIFRLCLSEKVDPVYLWQALSRKTMRNELSRLASGSSGSMPNISKARLKNLLVPLPPLNLQIKYKEAVNKFLSCKESQQKTALHTNNLFNSLLQKAFRGEL